MAYRPYFKHGIEQIQALVASSHGDLKALKVIQYELSFRDRPKARALKFEVDELIVNGDSKLIQISFAQRFKTDTPQIPSLRCNCCLQDGPKAQLEGGNYHAALNR